MKLGKSKKNTPGCLTNKAMSYIKSKPAMYGKPAKFEDQKGTSEGITKADVISARTKGYNPKMYGDPVKEKKFTKRVKKETGTSTSSEAASMRKAIKELKEGGHLNKVSQNADYSNVRETKKQFGKRMKSVYDNKMGKGAADRRYRNSNEAKVAAYLGKDKLSKADYKKYINPKTGRVKVPSTFSSTAEKNKFFKAIGRTKK